MPNARSHIPVGWLAKYRSTPEKDPYALSSLKDKILWYSVPSRLNDPAERTLAARCSGLPATVKKRALDTADRVGIHSLSKHVSNTVLWHEYADAYRGFAILYNTPLLRAMDGIRFYAVKYVQELKPVLAPHHTKEALLELRFTKTIPWGGEAEMRSIIWLDPRYRNQGGWGFPVSEGSFGAVVLGLETNGSLRKEIIHVLRTTFKKPPPLYTSIQTKSGIGIGKRVDLRHA